jgi:hypothetical protein
MSKANSCSRLAVGSYSNFGQEDFLYFYGVGRGGINEKESKRDLVGSPIHDSQGQRKQV